MRITHLLCETLRAVQKYRFSIPVTLIYMLLFLPVHFYFSVRLAVFLACTQGWLAYFVGNCLTLRWFGSVGEREGEWSKSPMPSSMDRCHIQSAWDEIWTLNHHKWVFSPLHYRAPPYCTKHFIHIYIWMLVRVSECEYMCSCGVRDRNSLLFACDIWFTAFYTLPHSNRRTNGEYFIIKNNEGKSRGWIQNICAQRRGGDIRPLNPISYLPSLWEGINFLGKETFTLSHYASF